MIVFVVLALIILYVIQFVIKKEYFEDVTPDKEGQKYTTSNALSAVEAFRVGLVKDTKTQHNIINVLSVNRYGGNMNIECMTSNCKTNAVVKYKAVCKLPMTSKGKAKLIEYSMSSVEDDRVGSSSIQDSAQYKRI